ncbi:MAG TPA: hypothetical protein DD670_11980 [Planctomycetaceae bacterium]|nr:hypothetical protein [Planctomycetaceae bacterium]
MTDTNQNSPNLNAPSGPSLTYVPWLVGTLLAVTVVAGVIALLGGDNAPPRENRLAPRFDYSLGGWDKIDPELIAYEQMAFYPVEMREARGVAVGLDDTICVVGDRALATFSADGTPLGRIELDDAPRCVAVDRDGTRYVGFKDRVAAFNADGQPKAVWEPLDARTILTSIAVGDGDVFVADAGNRRVLRYDASGKIQNELATGGGRNPAPPLVIPSPHFDVAVGTDGLVRVVNPGSHRITFFTPEGLYESPLTWGEPGMQIERFCGCCNPVAIALLGDNRVVTAEKGVPRVKVYSADGRFECVVASPEALGATDVTMGETRPEFKLLTVDLAIDRDGRILVLDPSARCVRVFTKKE